MNYNLTQYFPERTLRSKLVIEIIMPRDAHMGTQSHTILSLSRERRAALQNFSQSLPDERAAASL